MNQKESSNCVFIRDMRVMVRVGLLPAEEQAPQPLIVTAEGFTGPDYLSRALDGDFTDYAILHDCIKGWETRPHTRLLEELASSVFEAGFGQSPSLQAIRICIGKPDIFADALQSGIDLTLTRDDFEKNKPL